MEELAPNADRASFQIKIIRVSAVISPQRSERLPPIWHQIDKGVELVEGQHRPFRGPFLARAFDPAQVDDDQLDRCVQDRSQQAVLLSDHRG